MLDAPARQIRADRRPPALAPGVSADLAPLLGRHRELYWVGPQFCLPEVDHLAARPEQAPPQLDQLVTQGIELGVELRTHRLHLLPQLEHQILQRSNLRGQAGAIDRGRQVHGP